MNTQSLQLLNLTDLWQFHCYVRSQHIHGLVRQNGFVTSARNTLMLAFGLPLLSATLETDESATK